MSSEQGERNEPVREGLAYTARSRILLSAPDLSLPDVFRRQCLQVLFGDLFIAGQPVGLAGEGTLEEVAHALRPPHPTKTNFVSLSSSVMNCNKGSKQTFGITCSRTSQSEICAAVNKKMTTVCGQLILVDYKQNLKL